MKKLVSICFAVALILILALPSGIVAAEPPQKPITPNDLKELTFVHYAKPDKPPGKPDNPGKPDDPEPPPEVDNSYYELLGLYLPGNVTYHVNTKGAPAGAIAEIESAFEAWDAWTTVDLFNLPAEQTDVSGIVYDGQNTVSWVKIVPRNIIAITSIWYLDDGESTTLDEIVEFDIVFNAMLKWGVDQDGEDGEYVLEKAFDVRNIATHEVGHVAGLGDLYEEKYREITMYGYGEKGETLKISLEEGDRLGIQAIYEQD